MSGRSRRKGDEQRLWSSADAAGGAALDGDDVRLSPTAVRCIDRQLGETLDLAVTCRVLSDCSRVSGDPLTAVALARLSTDLCDQAAVLASLVHADPQGHTPPAPEPPSGGTQTCLAELDRRLSRAELVAQTDATPDLEAIAAALLWSLAAGYATFRELLLVCTLLDST